MTDNEYMGIAINEAKKCLKSKDVPVGAVIVKDNHIISKAYNRKEKCRNALAHSEIIAIAKASKKLKSYRLDDCVIYITKEPCLMCMGAILSARISKIVFGAFDPRFGTKDLANNNNFNHKCEIVGGICEKECKELLSSFFKDLRGKDASSRETKYQTNSKGKRK